MALPVVKSIKYTLDLPELGKSIKFRPMTTGEQKLFIQAIQLGDEKTLNDVNLDTVNACTFGALDLKKTPTHIVDLIYLNIYMKSKGEITHAAYTCNGVVTVKRKQKSLVEDEETGEEVEVEEEIEVEEKCGEVLNIKIPLDRAALVYPDAYEAKRVVMVDDESGIKLRAPAFGDYWAIDHEAPIEQITVDYLFQCIECIFTGDAVQVPGTDFTLDEFKTWYDTLPATVSEKIDQFFDEMPQLSLDLPARCIKCGTQHTIKLRGLADFFE